MNIRIIVGAVLFVFTVNAAIGKTNSDQAPLGKPGTVAEYRLNSNNAIPKSNVKTFILSFGPLEEREGVINQWLQLHSLKANGDCFTAWILTRNFPPTNIKKARKAIARYILKEGDRDALEFRHRFTGEVVLPILGTWPYLFPQPNERNSPENLFSPTMRYLGKQYQFVRSDVSKDIPNPPQANVLELLPDAMIGVPHNTRLKDDTRRYDDSDYETIRLTKTDYDEMIEAGMNCFRADPEQTGWLENRNVFYWGIGGKEIRYPEILYRSNYLGPILFLDEPAVCTRDHVIRPRLREDQEFRKSITPQICFEKFQTYFDEANNQKNPTVLLRNLVARPDVDTGEMNFLQQNLYTWETMVSTALYQLADKKNGPPSAIVFEPPGRVGTRRTLPEMNMVYRCQIPVDRPNHLTGIIYGFLRGAARSTDKTWGTSIYGSVDRSDAFWFFTHAYDLGAQFFFCWDTHRLACVPHNECLALARGLRNHIENRPYRDLHKLKRAAETAILLPAGYNLGHVHLGKGNLWGIGELNLERINRKGIKYRTVMGNFFTEIERCLRLGTAFDLFWDLETFQASGYREIVRVREDGKVEVETKGQRVLHDGPRIPSRPEGDPPQITIDLTTATSKGSVEITALARLTEGSSPVYYTSGTNTKGIYVNSKIFWELYGPEEEDYRTLSHEFRPVNIQNDSSQTTVEMTFKIERPGKYRLRAAACDQAGRTTVEWKNISIEPPTK